MAQPPQATEQATERSLGEWFWRFLAAALLFALGWVAWIAYQINPSPLATPAAYQAAVQALASRNVQAGMIKAAETAAPIDTQKLRLAETLETPIGAPLDAPADTQPGPAIP